MKLFGIVIMSSVVWLAGFAFVGATLKDKFPKWEPLGVFAYLFLTGGLLFVFGG